MFCLESSSARRHRENNFNINAAKLNIFFSKENRSIFCFDYFIIIIIWFIFIIFMKIYLNFLEFESYGEKNEPKKKEMKIFKVVFFFFNQQKIYTINEMKWKREKKNYTR